MFQVWFLLQQRLLPWKAGRQQNFVVLQQHFAMCCLPLAVGTAPAAQTAASSVLCCWTGAPTDFLVSQVTCTVQAVFLDPGMQCCAYPDGIIARLATPNTGPTNALSWLLPGIAYKGGERKLPKRAHLKNEQQEQDMCPIFAANRGHQPVLCCTYSPGTHNPSARSAASAADGSDGCRASVYDRGDEGLCVNAGLKSRSASLRDAST